MIKVLKNNKGFTLAELIVVMVVSSLVLASIAAMLPSILGQYEQANELAERNTMLNNIANQIISDMADATKPIADSDGEDNYLSIIAGANKVIYTRNDEGVLLRNESVVLPKGYYKKERVSFSCVAAKKATKTAYILTVTISSTKSGGSLSREYAVAPIALNLYD